MAPSTIPEDEDAIAYGNESGSSVVSRITSAITAPKASSITQQAVQAFAPKIAPQTQVPSSNETKVNTATYPTTESALPDQFVAERSLPATTTDSSTSVALQTQDGSVPKIGFFQKTTTWVKENPGKTILVAGGLVAGGILVAKVLGGSKSTNGLSGLPSKPKKKRKHNNRRKQKQSRVKRQILL
jgi:hypothetical protein